MLVKGRAKKVTIYLNEDTRRHLTPLYQAILDYLLHKGVAGATVSRAMAGFGSHRVVHTPNIEVLAEHLPMLVEFIESPEKVDEVLPGLYEMVTDGVIEVQDTTVVKAVTREGHKPEPSRRHEKRQGAARLMRVFIGEADEWKGEPLYEAIVKQLRMLEISGATVYRGILGYGAKGHTHKKSFWHLSRDLPVTISVVDTLEKINAAVEAIEPMIGDGLIATSEVEMTRLVRSPAVEEHKDAGTTAG